MFAAVLGLDFPLDISSNESVTFWHQSRRFSYFPLDRLKLCKANHAIKWMQLAGRADCFQAAILDFVCWTDTKSMLSAQSLY